MKNKISIIISVLVLIIGFSSIFIYNNLMKSKAVEGSKSIEIVVLNDTENYKKEYKHKTDATTLTEALEEMKIAKIENGQYGSFLVGVDNYKADESKQQWWKIIVNSKDAETGMDTIMINDGDKIDLVLTTGW